MIIEAIGNFFLNFIFGGNVLVFGLAILFMHFIMMFLAKMPRDSMLVYLVFPIYALTQSGIFGSLYSYATYFLILIILGFTLGDRIYTLFQGK